MKVNLEALQEQLDQELQALDQRKAVLVDQIKHVEAVSRIAGRMESQPDEESKPTPPPEPSSSPEELESEVEMESETEAQLGEKVNGKAPEASSGEGFEWAFQEERA